MNPIKKHLIILLAAISGLGIVLVFLFASSPLARGTYRASFERNFPVAKPVAAKAMLDLGYNSFYIAGITRSHIYLGNYTAPTHLVITDHRLRNAEHVKLRINVGTTKTTSGRYKVAVDSPYFYVLNGAVPEILRGEIDERRAGKFLPFDSAFFVESVNISANSFALRSYSLKTGGYALARLQPDSPYFQFRYGLLQKQIDGLFCVDGKLDYDPQLNRLVYLYFYRNQYVVMDTSLNLIHRYNTIDTFSRARLKVAHLRSGSSVLATPSSVVNGISCVYGKRLFIKSRLMAKNESEEMFKTNSDIDVYDLEGQVLV